ncbi:MAG TPA: hypothetical protein VEX86_25165 [Longimicrobium sp.]|nr:hypothetical protein [Longimicrobium sp.]
MRRVLPIFLLLLPLASGCVYRRTLYSPVLLEESGLEAPAHRFAMIRAVTVFPLLGRQWDLNLSVPSAMVKEGTEVRVPATGVHASFSEWRKPDRVAAPVTGRIRFVRVLPEAIQAEVDLRADVPSKWTLRRVMWFRYSPQAAKEMPWLRDSDDDDDDYDDDDRKRR